MNRNAIAAKFRQFEYATRSEKGYPSFRDTKVIGHKYKPDIRAIYQSLRELPEQHRGAKLEKLDAVIVDAGIKTGIEQNAKANLGHYFAMSGVMAILLRRYRSGTPRLAVPWYFNLGKCRQ